VTFLSFQSHNFIGPFNGFKYYVTPEGGGIELSVTMHSDRGCQACEFLRLLAMLRITI